MGGAANAAAVLALQQATATLPVTSSTTTNIPTASSTISPALDPSKPHDDIGWIANIAIWLLVGFAALFLCLRIFAKVLRRRGLWWDDHFLIAAWVVLAISAILQSITVSLGLGRYSYDVKPADSPELYKLSNVAGVLTIFAAAFSKTSFGITLLRLCEGWSKKFIWWVIGSVNAILLLAVLLQFLQCTPVARLWDFNAGGSCWPRHYVVSYDVFTAAYSGAMDIALALLPLKMIWSLTMNKKEKIGVMVAMSMGVFAGATSIWKIWGLLGALHTAGNATLSSLEILATAECAITIIAASIPILRALIRETVSTVRSRHKPQFFGSNDPLSSPMSPASQRNRLWPMDSHYDDMVRREQGSREGGSEEFGSRQMGHSYKLSGSGYGSAGRMATRQSSTHHSQVQTGRSPATSEDSGPPALQGKKGIARQWSKLPFMHPSRKRAPKAVGGITVTHDRLASTEDIELPGVGRAHAVPWESHASPTEQDFAIFKRYG